MKNIQSNKQSLYEQDFYLWTESTAKSIKDRNFRQVEWEYVIEEIETLGRSEKRELINRLTVLIEHLLKTMFWKDALQMNQRGWNVTIKEQRRQIHLLLKDSPSLKSFAEEIFQECYDYAVRDVMDKTNLKEETFQDAPFSLEEVLTKL